MPQMCISSRRGSSGRMRPCATQRSITSVLCRVEATAITVSLLGIVSAIGLYLTGKHQLEFIKKVAAPIYDLMYNKFYVDELYDFFFTKPMRAIGKFLEDRAERDGIDMGVDMVGDQVREASHYISILQSGKVRWYAFNTVAGLILVLVFVIFL